MKHLLKLNAITLLGVITAAWQMLLPVWADVTVTPELISEKVSAFVQESTVLEDPEAILHVDILRLPITPMALKGETLNFLFTDTRTTPYATRGIIQVTLTTEGETKQIGVPIRVSIEKPVWVSKKLIRAKEPLSLKNVTLQRKRLELEAPYSIGAKENITGYISRINIPPGSVLDVRKLKLSPAVTRNERVRMVMMLANGIKVSTYGIALETGAVGHKIRVSQGLENTKGRIYTAEIIDNNTVMVRI